MVPNIDKYRLLAGPWTEFINGHMWSFNQSQRRKSRTDVWMQIKPLLIKHSGFKLLSSPSLTPPIRYQHINHNINLSNNNQKHLVIIHLQILNNYVFTFVSELWQNNVHALKFSKPKSKCIGKHQNWSPSALFCHNSPAESIYTVINLLHTQRK